ncbi:hypothetical protein [Coxiella-like endosymbiont of Rhipicephalus sanguineus]|uniref:hypothetical protein n=1 Tax=Coxiella-like endosymbiont of Rhipicephalus sanguineus TaxID=1955402 RepID=UPI002041608E|nr:hypothetical protein [Coxiella-like endosymbiont of Rhipicephalus sanguineus]
MAFSRLLVGFGWAFAFVVALKIACIGLPANQFAFIIWDYILGCIRRGSGGHLVD